jgi:hypothetical protein
MINNQEILNGEIIDLAESKKQYANLSEEFRENYKDSEKHLNFLWVQETTFNLFANYLEAFWALKSGDLRKGYCLMDKVDIEGNSLKNNTDDNFWKNIKLQELISQATTYTDLFIFDNILSFSPEIKVLENGCSICGKTYKLDPKCEHIPGKLYMGKICVRSVNKFELPAVSIVKNPKNKYSRGWDWEIGGVKYKYEDTEMAKNLTILFSRILNPYFQFEITSTEVLKKTNHKHFIIKTDRKDIFERNCPIPKTNDLNFKK